MSTTKHPNSHEDQQACTEQSERIWSDALQQLELQMTRATFETWLKGTTAQLSDETLTVTVANPFAQDWLEHRLRPKIEAAVADTAGRPLTVTFAVNGNGILATTGDLLLAEEESQPTGIEHYEIWASAAPTVLRIMPDLAEEIGLNESIVLLQLDYWIEHSDNVRDGRRWTYQSSSDMQQKAFKWWHRTTIWRAVERLKEQALVYVTDKYNRHSYDRTPWFALNPEGFKRLTSVELKPVDSEVQHYKIWVPSAPMVLRIIPDLAEEIGLNESIVLLQIDHWIRHSDNVRDGRRWTFQSVRDMRQKAFRWWSNDTVNRTIASLIRQHLILATDEYNQHEYKRTRWFALNPEGFRMLESVELKRA